MLNALVVERSTLLDECYEFTWDMAAIAAGLTVAVAMIASVVVNLLWPRTRIGVLGAPLLSAAIAAPASALLLLSCGAQLEMDRTTGVLIWPPIASCAIVGVAVGVIMTAAVGLMRSGGRSGRRRA